MYDILLQGKISVVRTCDGKEIKATDCIIKVANVTFLFIKGLHIQKQKAHDNLCFPLRRAYLLLSSTYLYARVMVIFTTSYISPFSLGKRHVLGNDLDIYIHTNIFDHELLLLTIIYMINKLGGETLSPYLSLCSMDAICCKNML